MKSKVNFKNLILSVVALILVMMLTVGVTYSWIEDVKQVQFSTKQEGDEAPLKTGTDINAVAEIVQGNSTINLGNILGDSDLKDTNTGNFLSDVVNRTQSKMSDINKKKGYFYESGDMHLSPCYSDGIDFYFPVLKPDGTPPDDGDGVKYRKGNKNDENVNYIAFTFKVSSPTANTAYWFDKNGNDPWFSILDSNDNHINNACMSITVDGITKVFTWSPLTGISKNGSTSSGNTYSSIRAADYTYGDGYNTDNANTLFTVAKGTEKNVNVKIWIDAGHSLNGATISDIDIKLTSSWAKTIKYNIEDKTSGESGGWAIDSSKFYVAFPEYYDTYNRWELDKNYFLCDTNSSNHNGSFTVPAVYSGEYAYIYRCSSDGWDADSNTNTLPNANDPLPNNSHSIKAYNYWKTTLPNSYIASNSSSGTYKFYGGAYDREAAQAIEDNADKATHLGCGTWGNLRKIILHSRYRCVKGYMGHTADESNPTNFATAEYGNTYLRDFSDEKTVKTIYTYKMSWDDSNDHKYWWTYAPESSKLIQFYYYSNNNGTHKGWWGYRSNSDECPQRRPDNVYEYHIAGNIDSKGIAGYWEGENKVYLIKNGNLASTNILHCYDYMYIDGGGDGKQNESWPGRRMTDTGNTLEDNSPILSSDTVYDQNFIYQTVIFSNGPDNSSQSGDLLIYAGCYFDYQHNCWYGDVDRTEISVDVTDTSRDSDLVGPTTTYPTSNGIYMLIQKDGNYYYKISDSTGSSAAGSNIKVELGKSNDYTVWIIKYDNGGTNYGTKENNPNDYFDPSSGNNRDFSTGTGNPVRMRVATAGKYNFSIASITSTNIRLSFSSAS